jgi:hypothetical protein
LKRGILFGYFFGRQWKRLESWLGPTTLCLVLADLIIIVLGMIFKRSLWRAGRSICLHQKLRSADSKSRDHPPGCGYLLKEISCGVFTPLIELIKRDMLGTWSKLSSKLIT